MVVENLRAKYRFDPVPFLENSFPWGVKGTILEKYKLEDWQKQVANDIANFFKENPGDNCRVAVSSGRGVGKTAFVAMMTLWWLYTRPNCDINVFANTESQLKSTTYKELARWLNIFRYKNEFTFTGTGVYHNHMPNTWRVEPKTYDPKDPTKVRGQHGGNDRQMVVADEASGFPVDIFEAINGGFSQEGGLFMCISNPNPKGTGWFADIFLDEKFGSDWLKYEIDSRSVSITNRREIQKTIDKYGENSIQVLVHVMGRQIAQNDDSFILPSIIRAAVVRELETDYNEPVIMGIDIGLTSDPTSICIRQGNKCFPFDFEINDMSVSDDLQKQADVLAKFILEKRPDYVVIDSYGLGTSMKSLLASRGVRNDVYEYGPRSHYDSNLFQNKKTENYSRLKDWLYGADIPDDRTLRKELSVQRLVTSQHGRMQLMGKKDLRKKFLNGESPNKADALSMTFLEDFTKKTLTKKRKGGKLSIDNTNPLNRGGF